MKRFAMIGASAVLAAAFSMPVLAQSTSYPFVEKPQALRQICKQSHHYVLAFQRWSTGEADISQDLEVKGVTCIPEAGKTVYQLDGNLIKFKSLETLKLAADAARVLNSAGLTPEEAKAFIEYVVPNKKPNVAENQKK